MWIRLRRMGFTAVAALLLTTGVVLIADPALAVPGRVLLSQTTVNDSASSKGIGVPCPTGTVILGGGLDINGGGHSVRILQSGPQKNGWVAAAREDASGYASSWSVTVWAICGSQPTGYEIVSASGTTTTSGSVTATCPAGKKVIGAGGIAWNDSLHSVLDTIAPNAALTGVYVEAFHDETPPSAAYDFHALAICANPVPGLTRVGALSALDSNDKSASVTCPAGTKVHGLSGSISGATGQAYMDAMAPFSDGATVVAREDSTGYSGSWSIAAYAICAT